MNIILSKSTASSPQKSKLQQRFDKLWREVKNKQQANTRLEKELSELHSIYHEEILPVERLAEIPYTRLVQRLIELFGRKSLAQWQRYELSQWILECIEHIEPLNPQTSHQLTRSYYQGLADYLQVDIEDIEGIDEHANSDADLMDGFFENMEETMQGVFNGDEKPTSGFQDDLFEFSNGEPDQEGGERNADEDYFSAQEQEPKKRDVLSDKWITTIFRRTANALHPDKERNTAARLEKEKLMAQLLTARKQKDVFSLLKFYLEYVDGSDLLITDKVMEELCQQLGEQKHQLDNEKDRVLYETPMYAVLHQLLYSPVKKTRGKNIAKYIQEVEKSTAYLAELAGSLRNLKELKVHLEYRYEDRRQEELEEYLSRMGVDQ